MRLGCQAGPGWLVRGCASSREQQGGAASSRDRQLRGRRPWQGPALCVRPAEAAGAAAGAGAAAAHRLSPPASSSPPHPAGWTPSTLRCCSTPTPSPMARRRREGDRRTRTPSSHSSRGGGPPARSRSRRSSTWTVRGAPGRAPSSWLEDRLAPAGGSEGGACSLGVGGSCCRRGCCCLHCRSLLAGCTQAPPRRSARRGPLGLMQCLPPSRFAQTLLASSCGRRPRRRATPC